MRGKDKCTMLREIRRRIAEENDIELITSECTHQGECRGTCPKCESELRALQQALESRRSTGKRVLVAGLAAGMAITMSSCAYIDNVTELIRTSHPTPTPTIEDVAGYVAPTEGMPTPTLTPTPTPQIYELDGDVSMEVPET